MYCTTCLLLFSMVSRGNIWRVNNNSNYDGTNNFGENYGGTALRPVYKQLGQATALSNTKVQNGDTIHLEGSPLTYSNPGNISKKLVIIGAGYFLSENPNTSSDNYPSRVTNMNFAAGSGGSKIMGVWANIIDVSTSNISISRCRIDLHAQLANGISDVFIIGNYFSDSITPASSCIVMGTTGAPAGLIVKNNIIKKPLILQSVSGSGTITGIISDCSNNVFDCLPGNNIIFDVAECHNNIIRSAGLIVQVSTSNPSGISHNSSNNSSDLLGEALNNNIQVDMNTLFVANGSSDGRYKLNAGSAAGNDGTERGVFGSASIASRYSLSGLAPIPVIYNLQATGDGGPSGIQVNINARIIN
mgnify:CR=1 FL=1